MFTCTRVCIYTHVCARACLSVQAADGVDVVTKVSSAKDMHNDIHNDMHDGMHTICTKRLKCDSRDMPAYTCLRVFVEAWKRA